MTLLPELGPDDDGRVDGVGVAGPSDKADVEAARLLESFTFGLFASLCNLVTYSIAYLHGWLDMLPYLLHEIVCFLLCTIRFSVRLLF